MKRKDKKKRGVKSKKGFNLNGYIFGALRKIWRWHPERKIALDLAKVHYSHAKDQFFVCASCDHFKLRNQLHVDHIKPVIDPDKGFTSWDEYISRLFVSHKYLQVLCKDCHLQKTRAENKRR